MNAPVYLDGQFWAGYFKSVFAGQISLFCRAVERRLLSTFDFIEGEAEQASNPRTPRRWCAC
jgi:hypothetical protein